MASTQIRKFNINVYEAGVQEQLEAYKHKTARQKYAKSDHYQKFKQAIYEVQHPDVAMPPLTDLIPREAGDDSDDEDELQIGGVTQDYKCPLSLTILVDPLTSKVCGHSYSAAAIREYLHNSRNQMKECPATGCKKQISLALLEPNKELAKRAKEASRRERAREEDSGDDEVIE
ncbi:zinc-finger of the MIZ type in Nse subunit-domain-containing protein [Trametes punicea]|nr:zinc-finger of the MIZ type in Nse subunit-domain-containing protein [Trametes punicea]